MRHSSTFITPTTTAQPQNVLSQEDQKLVNNAMDILMLQRNLSEEQAFTLLTEMAQKRKTGLVDISLQLVNITQRLTI